MIIKKYWTKLFFTAASFFWMGCSDSSVSSVENSENGNTPNSSSSAESSSSSDEVIPPMSSTTYGVEPIFRSSSSKKVGSSSSSEGLVTMDSLTAAVAAAEACAGHGGVEDLRAYFKPWTSPERRGVLDAQDSIKTQIEATLKSNEAASFSAPKKNCLESAMSDLGCMATMYGVPSLAEYDKWSAVCVDETIVKSDALKTLDEENEVIRQRSEAEELQRLKENVDKCDSATEEEYPSDGFVIRRNC